MLTKPLFYQLRTLPTRWQNRKTKSSQLLSLMFHQVLPKRIPLRQIDFLPFQAITTSQLGELADRLAEQGWQFPRADTLLKGGLDPTQNHVVFTFDDGYANNMLAHEVLSTRGIPWLLFPTLSHVHKGHAYWWDALWRAMRNTHGLRHIYKQVHTLKQKPISEIEAHIIRDYGEKCLFPAGELDRPLTLSELQTLAQSPELGIGSHGWTHNRFTLLNSQELAAEIDRSIQYLQSNNIPQLPILAYPNGDHNEEVHALLQEKGIQLAFDTHAGQCNVQTYLGTPLSLKRGMPTHYISAKRQLPNLILGVH